MIKKALLFSTVLFLAFSACSEEKPKNLIAEGTYKHMFIEFSIINQYDEKILQGRTRDELRQKVYEHYGVSDEEFRISHRYYEQDVDKQLKRITEISEMMRGERDSLMQAESRYNAGRQTPPDTLRHGILNR